MFSFSSPKSHLNHQSTIQSFVNSQITTLTAPTTSIVTPTLRSALHTSVAPPQFNNNTSYSTIDPRSDVDNFFSVLNPFTPVAKPVNTVSVKS